MDWPWDSGSTSLAGLVGICIVAILTGLLIPFRQHREQIAYWKQRGDDWKTAYDHESERNDKLVEIQGKLLTYAETSDRILRALDRPSRTGVET